MSYIPTTLTGLGASTATGLNLLNSTAAAVGAQQYSPSVLWTGKGWATGVNNSQSVAFQAYVVPVQAATNPSGLWTLNSSVNGGAFGTALTYDTAGNMIIPSSISVGGTAYTYGAPSLTGAAALLVPNTTYTVTGSATTATFQAVLFNTPTFTDASAGTITDLTNVLINGPAGIAGSLAANRKHSLLIVDSTSAASAITGGLVISTTLGTAATSIGMGGGNINLGGSLTVGGTTLLTTSSTLAGVNVGAYAGDPSGPNNGDLWYNSTVNMMSARNNGINAFVVTPGSNRANGYEFYDEFLSEGAGGSNSGTVTTTSGTGAVASNDNSPIDGTWIGVLEFRSGSTSAGAVSMYTTQNQYWIGAGQATLEERIHFGALSNGTDTYQYLFGFCDGRNLNGAAQGNGIFFQYNQASSANWLIVTSNGGVQTIADSGIAVVAGTTTSIKLKIVVNAAGTSAAFYVNGTQAANSPITTNIPTGTSHKSGIMAVLLKSAGTTSVTVDHDYLYSFLQLTTAR